MNRYNINDLIEDFEIAVQVPDCGVTMTRILHTGAFTIQTAGLHMTRQYIHEPIRYLEGDLAKFLATYTKFTGVTI